MKRRTSPDSDSGLLFLALERQMRHSPVHALRLSDQQHTPLGLLLIKNGSAGKDVVAALAKLRLETRQFHRIGDEMSSSSLPEAGQARDSCQVTVEERAQLFAFLHKDTRP
jgi:hypothetical protein